MEQTPTLRGRHRGRVWGRAEARVRAQVRNCKKTRHFISPTAFAIER